MVAIDPTIYQMLVIRKGLEAIKQGFRLNKAYTPRNLRLQVERITGKRFKVRDYDGMIAAMTDAIEQRHREVNTANDA